MIETDPGKELATTGSHWLGPYTRCTVLKIGELHDGRIQWYHPDGSLWREIRDANCENSGFVSVHDSTGSKYISIANPEWEIQFPRRDPNEARPEGYIVWTTDGKTFVHSNRGASSGYDEWPKVPTTIDVYTEGKRGTLGPYVGVPDQFYLDASGALAVHFLNGLLIVADRQGRERFRVDNMPLPEPGSVLACNEEGVLIGSHDTRHSIDYYRFGGRRISFSVVGGSFRRWIEGSRALFSSANDSLLLVDCSQGQVIWRRHDDRSQVVSGSEAYAVTGPYLMIADILENRKASQPRLPWVRLRAVELKTGKLTATWNNDWGPGDLQAQPRFFEDGGKVRFFSGSVLSEFDSGDIASGNYGWKSTEPPKPRPPQYEYGPPASPLSWKRIRSRSPADVFEPRQRITDLESKLVSVELVEFHDDRPYGEKQDLNVWLARYDSVQIGVGGSRTATLQHLSAVFDTGTGNLLCAFTDPAPRWYRHKAGSRDIAREPIGLEELQPADYATLQSTPGAVLAAFLRGPVNVDPKSAGQIILRPRHAAAPGIGRMFEGKLIPLYAPSNFWIVEVLGAPLRTEEWSNAVGACHDSTGKFLGMSLVP